MLSDSNDQGLGMPLVRARKPRSRSPMTTPLDVTSYSTRSMLCALRRIFTTRSILRSWPSIEI